MPKGRLPAVHKKRDDAGNVVPLNFTEALLPCPSVFFK